MLKIFRPGFLFALIALLPAAAFSQTATRIDNFAPQSARGGVLTIVSATLGTASSSPVTGASIDFQISDGGTWRSIVDDLTVTSNTTDSTGRAAVAFVPADNMAAGTYALRAVFNGNAGNAASFAETQIVIQQPTCNDEGVVFECAGAWEAIRIANHRTSSPGIPLILVHGNGQEDELNRPAYFGWAALRQSILATDAYAPFDVFIWKHDTARAIGFNGRTGNAADLAAYVNNRLLPRYPAGTKISFIAHSRGGLVVRSYMNYQDQGNAVARVVTLGTPHHGTPFAVPDWSALSWYSSINTDASVFDRVYAFAFDYTRLGSLSMAWDNLDGALNDTLSLKWMSALSPTGDFVLTRADANSTATAADATVFYSSSLKTAFGTLAELNDSEKYANKIITYGAFDDALADNDELAKQTLGSLLAAFALATDPHKALQVVTSFLATIHAPLKTAPRYYANDGLVPLQSALYLNTSAAPVVSQIDSQKRVSLNQISVAPNCGSEGALALGASAYRVWFGSRDQIQDHLDLLETPNACYWQALALDISSAAQPAPILTLQYGFPPLAGVSATTLGNTPIPNIGYVRIQPASGSAAASGFGIYGLRLGEILVSETAVLASPPLQRGRIYAETDSTTRTGVAMANPNAQDVTVSFFFTDRNGNDINRASFVLPARGQLAKFLDEAPFNGGAFSGTFTFDATLPIGALALQGYLNERSEFLMTTLPVAPLTNASSDAIAIPQFADGGGWTTSVFLVNSTDAVLTGTAEFMVNGQSSKTLSYSVAARSSTSLETTGALDTVQTGWIRITPTSATATPVSMAVFRLRSGSIVVSQTGVIAQSAGSSFSVYVESAGTSVRSGLAIANASPNPVVVSLDLTSLSGAPIGNSATVTVPAQDQISRFLTEFPGFENLPTPFQGILKVRSTSAPVSVVGLRGHVNERGDFLTATTPPLNNDFPTSNSELIIPHFVDGGGYTTQFVLFSGTASGSSGTILFLDRSGQPLGVTVK